jgi:hypothetical protein
MSRFWSDSASTDGGESDMANVTAAILWPGLPFGKIYFFSGDKYFKYDILSESVEAGPLPVAGNWPGLGGVSIQGAVAWPTGKAFFFSDDKYYSYNMIAPEGVDSGFPRSIHDDFPSWGMGGDHHVDAAFVDWTDPRRVYMFQNRFYGLYNATPPIGIPPLGFRPIIGDWAGLIFGNAPPFIKAAIPWPKPVNGRMKIYFFQNDKYVRYDILDKKVDQEFASPQPIAGNWPGL